METNTDKSTIKNSNIKRNTLDFLVCAVSFLLIGFVVMLCVCVIKFNANGSTAAVLASADAWLGFMGAIAGGLLSGGITLTVLIVSRQQQEKALSEAINATNAAIDAVAEAALANKQALRIHNESIMPNLFCSRELTGHEGRASDYSIVITNIGIGAAVDIVTNIDVSLWGTGTVPSILKSKESHTICYFKDEYTKKCSATIDFLYWNEPHTVQYLQRLVLRFSELGPEIVSQLPSNTLVGK